MQNKSKPLIPGDLQRRQQRMRQLRNWAILLGAIMVVVIGVLVVGGLFFGSGFGNSRITALSLPCYAHQDVTVFRDGVLYYDGASIHFVNAGGGIEWSHSTGDNASFTVSDSQIIIWRGFHLTILNANGDPSYDQDMTETIQFARIGSNHAAIITGEPLTPTVYVKDLQGAQMDTEVSRFDGHYLLDCGFYGARDEYLWTLSYDFYNPVVSSVLHTFQVGQMNTGIATITPHLPDKVLYLNNMLNVFTTQQMYTFDYKGVKDTENTMLVYGWKYIDHDAASRDNANILLAPAKQADETQTMTDLRVLSTTLDRRFTLPSPCFGAAIRSDRIFAFSPEYIYSGHLNSQRFYAHDVPLPDERLVSEFVGLTTNGYAIVTSGREVSSVSLPK